ncbi:MAG: hypothetical protein ACOC40_03135 [Thermoplasmatota archaeon]
MVREEITIKPTAWDEEEEDKLMKRMGVVLDFRSYRDNGETATAEISNQYTITVDIETAIEMWKLLGDAIDEHVEIKEELEKGEQDLHSLLKDYEEKNNPWIEIED